MTNTITIQPAPIGSLGLALAPNANARAGTYPSSTATYPSSTATYPGTPAGTTISPKVPTSISISPAPTGTFTLVGSGLNLFSGLYASFTPGPSPTECPGSGPVAGSGSLLDLPVLVPAP